MSLLLKHTLKRCRTFSPCRSDVVLLLRRLVSETAPAPHMGVPVVEERPLDLAMGKVKREPFVKNMFIGKLEKAMLAYPEVLSREKLEELEAMADAVRRFYDANVDTAKIDREKNIPKEILDGLKALGLFGLQVPTEYGGLGLTATEYARICEVTGKDASLGVTLAAHNSIGIKGILLCGNEEQRRKYLPKLATGEHVAAFCLTEPTSGSDAASIQLSATPSHDKKTYYLNGSKIYISNGGFADIMTVFAKVKVEGVDRKKQDKITAFIVERAFGGVTSGAPEDKLGIRGSNTTSIFFDNTPVPAENILGEVGDGFKVAMNILNNGRFGMGAALAGGLRELIGYTSRYAVERVQFEKPLSDFDMIKDKIYRMTSLAYAIESMVYVASAIIDVVEEPDCALECAIVKVFSSDAGQHVVNECLQIHGGSGFMTSLPIEQYYRDIRILSIFEGTNEILRLFIALMGLQHTGKQLSELILKMRNPLANPLTALQKLWERRRDAADNPVCDLDLHTALHPSLMGGADTLEYCVKRLKYTVEIVLQRYGKEIIEQQMVLSNLADMVIHIYAMACVLGRASRSYCIGLPNADKEVDLALCFCHDARKKVKSCENEIDDEMENLLLLRKRQIADKVFEDKAYFPVHPLTKNY
ncbi:complex I assembly factor ACAD9, mitochondrial-like [Dermacentor albipictus]|uniref:complex I assembly factor ACAD9, mitochondrial-like n=1 Tax=Dermacentor albipictus TaxID=60249 RepID=UPI0031FDA755